MADAPEEKWADFNPLISGSNIAGGETPAPPRGWSGAVMDTGIDVVKSIAGMGKQVAGVYEGVAGAAGGNRGPAARGALQAGDTYSDIGTVLEGMKTPRGQELTRQPESFSESPGKYMVNTAINMAPYIPIAMGTGGVGAAAAFGALGFGQVRSDLRENLRNASPEELAKNPQYVDLRDQGMTHEQAIDEIYLDATDPRKLQTYIDAAPNVIGQAATGGVGGSVIKGLTHGATRKITSDIVQRVIDKTNTNFLTRKGTGVAMGAGAGALAGGGQDLSRQMSEQTAGQQREGINWEDVGGASSEMAALFGTMGLAHKGTPKVKVPPIGTHVEAAAADMVDAASGKTMPAGPAMKPPPKPKMGMAPGDLGGSEYDVTGDWRRPDSTTPLGAARPPTAPPEPHVPPEMSARDYYDLPTETAGPHLADYPVHGPEEMYGPPPGEYQGLGAEPSGVPVEPGRPMVGGDIYRGMAPPEGSAPLPYGETYAPRPGDKGRKPIVTGGREPGEGSTGVPVAGKLVEPPGPERPRNISTDARYVGETYDGRQIWESGGFRQYEDPETGARRTESKKKSGDLDFRTAEEIPEPHRVTPETIEADKGQLAALMDNKSPATRGSMARILEGADQPKLALFPKIGQAMFGPLRHKLDQMLHFDREGTINAIRGDPGLIKVAERAVPKEAPIPPVEFGAPAEGRTEVPYEPREEEFRHTPAAEPPKGYQPSAPAAGAKATPAVGADVGLSKKGDRYKKEYRLRMQQQAGVRMALPEREISTQFKGKITTRREPMTLSEGMQRIKARLEMRTEERRQVADKIRSLTTEGKTGMLHESKTPRIAVVEKGRVIERTEAERQRKTWRQQEEAEMADVVKQRTKQRGEQAYDEAAEAQRNEEARIAVYGGLEDYQKWELVQRQGAGPEKLPDFWANRERMDKENAAEIRAQLAKDRREKDSDRKENKRASHYRIRDLIAKGVLKKLKTSFKHLNDILTGVALDENGKYITKEGEARAEKWVTEAGMKDEFKPFLSLSMNDLKQVAYAFAREAKDRIALADKRFNDASVDNWKEGHGHWTVGRSVGWRRSEKGVHYNQLVDDKVFVSAVARYSGTAKKVSKKTDAGNRLMLQAIVMNHWISQKLALEGNTHKMREFYKERNNALREQMMEKYNVLSTSSTAGERLALEKDLEKAKEILQDDARYAEEQMEHFRNIDRPMVDFWQEMADAGLGHLMPEGDVGKTALNHAMNYLSNDIREQHERDAVAERRARIEDQKSAVRRRASEALEKKMFEIHGEGWLGATARDKETMLDTYIEGDRGKLGRPTTPKGEPVEPGRPMVPDDLEKGFREQLDYVEHGKPLSPEGRAYRLNMLMERSDQIMDEIEADPKRANDPRVTDELRLLENEVRRHYEDAVPEAKNNEFGIGRVLENGTDLSKPENLPRGAYVRRVSDYLQEGKRGIRSGLDRVEGKLRNHLLDVAQRTVGDMEVVALTAEQMDMAAREKNLPGDTPSFYDPNSHRVFISQRVLHGADRDRILGHELAHPLTLRAAEMFPGIAKKLNEQLQLLRDAYYKPSDRAHGDVHRALDGNTQALDNIHEFVGELYNDGGRVAQALHAIETPSDLRKAWRTDTLANAFGDVLATIKNGLNKLLFQSSKKRLLNDATLNSLHLFDRLEAAGMYTPPHGRYEALPFTPPTHGKPDPARKPTSMEEVTSSASEGWKDVKFRLQRMGLSGALLKASTFVELRRRAEQGMQDVVRVVEDVWSKVETTARNMFRDSGAEDIAMAIAQQMRMPAAVFQKLQDYVNLENHWKVSGEHPLYEGKNSWVSKDSPYHEHYRTRHETLSRMYDELSPDQKELRRRMLDYYESQHDKVLRANLTKVIQLRDMVPGGDRETSDALIKHVLKEDLSTHEKTLLDKIPGYESEIDLTNKTPDHIRFRNNLRELRGNPIFKKVEGVWYPAKRRGNYVVEARYDLSGEAEKFGGRKVDENGNTWEFDDADNAQKFYEAVSGSEAYGGIHFEGKTEHVYKADEHGRIVTDAEGKPIPETYYSERTSRTGERPDPSTPDAEKVPFTETTTGGHRRVTAKEAEGEPGTVTRHRVEFNPLLLEFYENPRHAYERHAELQGDANLKLTHVEPKRDTSGTYLDPKKASKVMETLFNSLERGRGWENMDKTTRDLTRRDLEEAAVQHIMSSSARSMRIPRRYALGADKSLLRDFNDYAHNSSRTLAELHHRDDLSAALKGMDDYVGDHRQWTAGGDEQNKYGELRAKLQGEVHKRIFTRPSDIVAPFWTKLAARILQLSYLDKLMSPGFVVLNATEPWVLGAPLLTGHHGFKAYGEIGKAYAAIGFHGVWGKGLVNAGRAIKEGLDAKFEDNHTLLTDRLKGEKDAADLIAMHEYGAERGYFDRDAGQELAARRDPSISKVGHTLDYMDNVSRQVNVQIENVNRSVMAIASYRLGRQKGWSHEKSMQHAFDMVHDTSGNYGHWNTPAMFNDPRLKFALQFKRYSQRITANYVRMFAQAFSRLPSEQRAIARKQLGVMLGSQIIFSGALGLPTEPIKLALLATSPLTGFGPDEAEIWAREAAAKATGNDQLAEGLMRGFPRAYLDIGIGTRLGHDSIWTHGTLGKKPDNWFSSLGHFVGGAPASMMADWAMAGGKGVDAIGHLARGNMTQAGADATEFMQLALPFKLGSDMIGSATTYLGGPKTMSTAGQPLGYQPTMGQALLEASGIRSGTSQEASDKRFAISQAKARANEFKNKAFQMYVRAGSSAEQRAIEERAIAKSKEDWPKGMQLTHGDFFKAKQRFARNQTVNPDDVGVSLSKREGGLRDRFSFFNN